MADDLERKEFRFPIDANLQASVAQLEKEGWGLIPGVPPIAVYDLIRLKGSTFRVKGSTSGPSGSAVGKMVINEDLIMVIPADKLDKS